MREGIVVKGINKFVSHPPKAPFRTIWEIRQGDTADLTISAIHGEVELSIRGETFADSRTVRLSPDQIKALMLSLLEAAEVSQTGRHHG
jgi:hypothetical protein